MSRMLARRDRRLEVVAGLEERAEKLGVGAFGRSYDIRTERAHAHPQCETVPHFDWAMVRE